jgi:hypothetical protein
MQDVQRVAADREEVGVRIRWEAKNLPPRDF